MGKKSAINSLSKIIASIIVHKILFKYTNKPESVNHLSSEVTEYRDTVISGVRRFNWNVSDKEQIKINTLKYFRQKMAGRYPDVKYPDNEVSVLIDETMGEVGLLDNFKGFVP